MPKTVVVFHLIAHIKIGAASQGYASNDHPGKGIKTEVGYQSGDGEDHHPALHNISPGGLNMVSVFGAKLEETTRNCYQPTEEPDRLPLGIVDYVQTVGTITSSDHQKDGTMVHHPKERFASQVAAGVIQGGTGVQQNPSQAINCEGYKFTERSSCGQVMFPNVNGTKAAQYKPSTVGENIENLFFWSLL